MRPKTFILLVVLSSMLLFDSLIVAAPVTITAWLREGPTHEKFVKAVVEEFHRLHPDIRVELVSMSIEEGGLLLHAMGGNLPMVTDTNHADVFPLVEAGAAVDLSIFPDLEEFMEWNYTEQVRRFAHTKGPDGSLGYYIVPAFGSTFLAGMNNRLASEAGIDVRDYPRYWDEWVQLARKATQDLDGDGEADVYGTNLPRWGAAYLMGPVLNQLHKKTNSWTFRTDDGSSVFEAMRTDVLEWFDWVTRLSSFATPHNSTFEAETQMLELEIGSYNIANWKRTSPNLLNDVQFFDQLQVDAEHPVWYTGSVAGYVMWNQNIVDDEQLRAAWEFMKFLASPYAGIARLEATGEIPYSKNITVADIPLELMEYAPFLQASLKTNATAGRDLTNELFEHYFDVRQVLWDQYRAVVVDGNQNPVQALQKIIDMTSYMF